MDEKRAFTKYAKSVLRTPRPKSTGPVESLPPEHPFYSQYNLLKTKNALSERAAKPKNCANYDLQFSKQCEREFSQYVTYQVRKNCPNYDYENHLVRHTGINLIGNIVRDLPDPKTRGKDVWDLLKRRESEMRNRS